jgi:hypothetical protein
LHFHLNREGIHFTEKNPNFVAEPNKDVP